MTTTVIQTKSKVRRLAGSIIAETKGEYYLIGELKEPYNFDQSGFEQPPESHEENRLPYRKLSVVGEVRLKDDHYLEMKTAGEELAKLLFKRFVIHRNNSISNRLWNVVTCNQEEGVVDACWLEQMPDDVWDIVRDSILRCV